MPHRSRSKPRAECVQVGEVVGSRYEVRDRLGEGGMATVYLAHDHHDEREVALKVMHPAMAEDALLRQRFSYEARGTMSIIDPHVVELIDFGELDDGTPYYVMERLAGQPLNRFAAGRRLPIDHVLQVGVQVCRGLAAAHAKNIIHRDLKPENLFVADGLRVKVLDFGIAKLEAATSLTVPGSIFGTPQYMSPEQALPERGVDHRTDIYSFGVLLYELLTGDVPFDDDEPMAVMLSHLEQVPDPLCQRRSDVPPALASIVERCLQKRPDLRYQSMQALGDALERVLATPSRTTIRVDGAELGMDLAATAIEPPEFTVADGPRTLVVQRSLPTVPLELQGSSAADARRARVKTSRLSLIWLAIGLGMIVALAAILGLATGSRQLSDGGAIGVNDDPRSIVVSPD